MKIKRLLLIPFIGISMLMAGCQDINQIDNNTGEEVVVPEVNYFTVTFLNYDNSFLYSSLVEEGHFAVYKGVTPTRKNEGAFKFIFVGWDKPLETTIINENTTFTAVYESRIIQSYDVTFTNYNGDILYQDTVSEGGNAIYRGPTPTRPDDESGNKYTFVGWNKSLENIQADTIFTAVYSSKKASYVVKFLNFDESLLDIQYAAYGAGVNYTGETPTRPSSGGYDYTFSGWDKNTSFITSNLDVHAEYTKTVRKVTVTFLNYDGSFLSTTTVNYGESASYSGRTPTREREDRIEYVFSGWNIDLSAIYNDVQATAQFNKKDRSATVGLNFGYDSMNEIYFVTGYTGGESEVYIPKVYNNGINGEHPVTKISSWAFSENNSTYNISKIFIEDNVTEIASDAIRCQYSLKTVRLPNKIKKLNSYFIRACNSLKDIEIPASVSEIDEYAFKEVNSSQLNLTVNENNPYFFYKDGVMYNKNKTAIVFALTNYYLETLVLEEGLKTINARAFQYCNGFSNIVFPSTLESIGEYAFWNSNGINSITFNDSKCDIGRYAFGACYNLQSIDLGNGINSIGEYAFGNLNITSIDIPASVTSISSAAFNDCNQLMTINLDEENENYMMMSFILTNKNCTDCIFICNANNKNLKINDKFTGNIDGLSIRNKNVGGFEVDENNTKYSTDGCILYSKDQKTLICGSTAKKEIKKDDIPSTVDSIRDSAFYSNKSLEKIDLSNTSIQYLSNQCFYDSGLKEIVFPDTIQQIYNQAFGSCYSLKEITIPDTVTYIYEHAFMSCNNLEKVVLPKDLTNIRYYTFGDCISLKEIDIPNKVTSLGGYAFYNCDSLVSIDLPDGLLSIGYCCFNNCDKLKEITIPDTVTSIENDAFRNCPVLETIYLSNSITNLSTYVFADCTSLKSVNIPDGITSLSANMFNNCNSLDNIVIPKSVTYLRTSVLANCYNFKKIFYMGTSSDWSKIAVEYDWYGTNYLSSAKRYYFSEKTPTEEGDYWHYVDGVPTIWEA